MVSYINVNGKVPESIRPLKCVRINGPRFIYFLMFIFVLTYLTHQYFVVLDGNFSKKQFFGIIIDAGSTGSRVHVYEFKEENNEYIILDELFKEVKPGLSSYDKNPSEAAKSISYLLNIAKKRIPEELWSSTPLSLKATAGLRMLPEDATIDILSAVSDEMQTFEFKMIDDAVSIMSGADEGIFGWMTINLLLNHISSTRNDHKTVGVIDLGGGSMQICFLPKNKLDLGSDDEFHHQINFFKDQLDLYVHSYLGFGLMSAKEAVLQMSVKSEDVLTPKRSISPCFPSGFSTTWSNHENIYEISSSNGEDVSNWFNYCYSNTKRAVVDNIKSLPSGESSQGVFYVFSYFFDIALKSKLIDENGGTLTPQSYLDAAEKACQVSNFNSDEPFLCVDLCLLSSFLLDGYGFDKDTKLHAVKRIDGRETSWTLGAIYSNLN